MRDLLDFKTKRDRNDFFIAISVIGLFASFLFGVNSCDRASIIPAEVVAAVVPVINDSDEDGIPNEIDNCPNVKGIALNGGCPADTDADGIYDEMDKCPNLAGVASNDGCPSDADQDGIPDKQDLCPDLVGVIENDGCPSDLDGDGVYDVNDKCPEKIGTAENGGCPKIKSDVDADGVYDAEDKCPYIAGPVTNNGCPMDSDKDGIVDSKDRCPQVSGVPANGGCPADTDKDGIYDSKDKCPTQAGTAANGGCPALTINEADLSAIRNAVKNIEFLTSSANLKPTSLTTLNSIIPILKKYKNTKINISGHTDSIGNAAVNLELSKARALTCYNYLISKGIAKERIAHQGFGASKPIATNDTPQGRKQNRRVEFKLY